MSIREPNVAMVMMRPICNILGWLVAKLAILQSPYQMYCITLMAIFDLLEVGYRIIALSSQYCDYVNNYYHYRCPTAACR